MFETEAHWLSGPHIYSVGGVAADFLCMERLSQDLDKVLFFTPDVSNPHGILNPHPEIADKTPHFPWGFFPSLSLPSNLREVATPEICSIKLYFHLRSPSLCFWDPPSVHRPEEKDQASRFEVSSRYSLS